MFSKYSFCLLAPFTKKIMLSSLENIILLKHLIKFLNLLPSSWVIPIKNAIFSLFFNLLKQIKIKKIVVSLVKTITSESLIFVIFFLKVVLYDRREYL